MAKKFKPAAMADKNKIIRQIEKLALHYKQNNQDDAIIYVRQKAFDLIKTMKNDQDKGYNWPVLFYDGISFQGFKIEVSQ